MEHVTIFITKWITFLFFSITSDAMELHVCRLWADNAFFNEEKKNQIFRISYYNIYFPKYSLNK